MSLKILKLAFTATTTVTTDPSIQKFFYTVDTEMTGPTTLRIEASDFMDDSGNEGVTLPEVPADNGYITVYVNGVQIMQDLLTYVPGENDEGYLEINVPLDSKINQDAPVVLVVTTFTPSAQTNIEG